MSAYILLDTQQEAEAVKQQLLSIAGVWTVSVYFSKYHNKFEVKINAGTAQKIGLTRGSPFTKTDLDVILENNPKKH